MASRTARLAALLIATCLTCGLGYQVFYASYVEKVLSSTLVAPHFSWILALHVSHVGYLLSFAWAGHLVLALVGARKWPLPASPWFWSPFLVGMGYALSDAYLYRNSGRHILDLIPYLGTGQAGEAIGSKGRWALRLAFWFGVAALWAGLSYWGAQRCSAFLAKRKKSTQVLAAGVASYFSFGLCLLPWVLPQVAPLGLGARLSSTLPYYPRSLVASRASENVLERELARLYESRFAHLQVAKGRTFAGKETSPDLLPNICIIVVESLRADVLTPELMPGLFLLSQRGARFQQHFAGSNHSETGLFNLVFGRSSLTYHSSLNAKLPPTLFAGLKALGYETGYFSGHPKRWLRREEFLNPDTVDLFSHNDNGSWNQWDEGALARARDYLNEKGPRLALVFLMSSHYEYKYPEAFRRFTPDPLPKVAFLAGFSGREEFSDNRRRYHNVVGYIDHLITRQSRELDLTRTWLLVTGDHGEELGENGRFGHGENFEPVSTRVPLVWLGPGVSSRTLESPSLHQDVPETILSRLGFDRTENGTGAVLFESNRKSYLQAYPPGGAGETRAQLVADEQVLDLELGQQEPTLRLLRHRNQGKDVLGDPVSPTQKSRLLAAFEDALSRAASP